MADVSRYIGRPVKKLEELLSLTQEGDAGDSPGGTLADVDSRTLVKQVLVQGDRVMKPADGVTVLIYPRVGGGSGGEVDLDVDAFRAQLEHLRDHHTVIDLDTAAAVLAGGGAALPERAVGVTFDDGTDGFCDVVVPARRTCPNTAT